MVVAFASLFLGLVAGLHPVELVVGEGVAVVELRLDGAAVAEVSGPPWVAEVDFGAGPVPHELVAVARDPEGRELGRARQWINLPRPPAEANVLLDGAGDGRNAVARVSWESVLPGAPRSVRATFDGAPLQVDDPRRIELPDHDPEHLHLLRVELDFTDTLGAVAELVFGGGYRSETSSELTAVALELDEEAAAPGPEELAGRLLAAGEAVTPVAVEEGPGLVAVVMDRAAQPRLAERARRWAESGAGGSTAPGVELLRHDLRLGEDQVLRFLWPFSRGGEEEGVRYALFPRSEDHPPEHGGVLWLMTAARQPPFPGDEQRLADAVAVAGMTVAERGRRRAVVLLLGEEPADASRLEARAVRRYLSHLGVPLHVWAVADVPEHVTEAWGEVVPVDREHRFRSAVGELVRDLDRQRIAWVEGLHLPHRFELAPGVEGLRLVR